MFSADGRLFVTTRNHEAIRLWDASAPKLLREIEMGDRPWAPFLSAEPSWFGIRRRVYVNSVALSPDGRLLAAACEDNNVRLWDLQSGDAPRVLSEHLDAVHTVAFAPDGRTLASGSQASSYHDWIAEGCNTTLWLWDIGEDITPRRLTGHLLATDALAFSPDGTTLATGGYEYYKTGAEDSTVKLWDVASGENLRAIVDHDPTAAVAYSPDGGLLASGTEAGAVKIWNLAANRKPHTIGRHEGAVRSIAFSPECRVMASGAKDRTIKLWDIWTGRELRTLVTEESPLSVSFLPDGQRLAAGLSHGELMFWDVASGTPSPRS